MSDKIIENNQVTIMGQVASTFEFSHEVFGEGFYTMEVLVKRLSNSEDRIPVMISERLIDVTQDYVGEYIIVQGQFRSYNRHEEQKNRLVLSVFAREVSFVESDEDMDGVKTNSSGRVYLQITGIPQNAAWQGDRGSSAGCKPAVREVGLHSMYLLGTKREICLFI